MAASHVVPRPGSLEARELGCTCPEMESHHNADSAGEGASWWYNHSCLLHREQHAQRMAVVAAVSAELATRKQHWIAGIPTPSDIDAMVSHLAHRLKLPEATIRDTLGPMAAVA